jgi:MerR family mercuric resistance operon transcriptional regulator
MMSLFCFIQKKLLTPDYGTGIILQMSSRTNGYATMKTLSIGQLSKEASVNIETVRYYERRGLLPEPKRRESGYREYSQDDVFRIKFIKRAQELGFTLKEISELLELRVDSTTTCGEVKKQAEAKIADIEEKIGALKKMKAALGKLASSCNENAPLDGCPILEYLNESGNW